MSFQGHRPTRMPRLGSFIDWDDPTVTVPGLANIGKNVRYDQMTVGQRFGTKVGPSMTPAKTVNGLDVRTVLARTSGLPSTQSVMITATYLNTSQAVGTVNLGKSFELVSLLINSSCRIRLYRSSAGRNADLARDVNTPYVGSDLIFDLNADGTYTFPLTFACLFNPGTFTSPLSVATAYWTVDTYGLAVGSGWSGAPITAPPPSGDDPSNPFGDSYNEWTVSAGQLLLATSSPFYATEFAFLDNTNTKIGHIGGASIAAGASAQAFAPVGAVKVRGYAKTGNFADVFETLQVAASYTYANIPITFTELLYG